MGRAQDKQLLGEFARAILQHASQIGSAEILADEEQWAVMLLGDVVSEAVSEIEAGRVDAFAPSRINLANALRSGFGDGHYLQADPVDQ